MSQDNQKDYNKKASQLRRLILRAIDEDRLKSVQLYETIKQQIDQNPQVILLLGPNAVQNLDNLRKQVANLIKVYDIDKKKVTDKRVAQDIQSILKQIQKEDADDNDTSQ